MESIIGSLTNPLGPADQKISSLEIKFIFFYCFVVERSPAFVLCLPFQLKVAFKS